MESGVTDDATEEESEVCGEACEELDPCPVAKLLLPVVFVGVSREESVVAEPLAMELPVPMEPFEGVVENVGVVGWSFGSGDDGCDDERLLMLFKGGEVADDDGDDDNDGDSGDDELLDRA